MQQAKWPGTRPPRIEEKTSATIKSLATNRGLPYNFGSALYLSL
jgi:hypothetical protein